jgi:hypothetical protein
VLTTVLQSAQRATVYLVAQATSTVHIAHTTHTHGVVVLPTPEANTSLCPLSTSSHTHQGIRRNKLHCSTTQPDVHCTAHAPHSHTCPRTAHTHSHVTHTDSMPCWQQIKQTNQDYSKHIACLQHASPQRTQCTHTPSCNCYSSQQTSPSLQNHTDC